MIIYNVTIKVDWAIHDNWFLWMKQEHLADVVGTGCFTHSQLVRLIDIDETDGPTYAAQYFAERKEDYEKYIEQHATLMRNKAGEKWGEGLIYFRSLMEIV